MWFALTLPSPLRSLCLCTPLCCGMILSLSSSDLVDARVELRSNSTSMRANASCPEIQTILAILPRWETGAAVNQYSRMSLLLYEAHRLLASSLMSDEAMKSSRNVTFYDGADAQSRFACGRIDLNMPGITLRTYTAVLTSTLLPNLGEYEDFPASIARQPITGPIYE